MAVRVLARLLGRYNEGLDSWLSGVLYSRVGESYDVAA
jgi:hypothetical protein